MKNYVLKRLIAILYVFTPIISSAQLLTIEASITKDDGTAELRKSDSAHLKNFSIDNFDKQFTYKNRDDIDFELFGSEEFKQITSKHKYTWVFIQATGCGGCSIMLPKYVHLADSLKDFDIKIVVVNQDIHLRQLKKKLWEEKYCYQSYVLNPRIYGTSAWLKQQQFVREIANTESMKDFKAGAIPANFFFDQSGNFLYYANGNAINYNVLKEKVLK